MRRSGSLQSPLGSLRIGLNVCGCFFAIPTNTVHAVRLQHRGLSFLVAIAYAFAKLSGVPFPSGKSDGRYSCSPAGRRSSSASAFSENISAACMMRSSNVHDLLSMRNWIWRQSLRETWRFLSRVNADPWRILPDIPYQNGFLIDGA